MADNPAFGHSLKMASGDLVFEGERLVETAGQANLLQAPGLRILTPFGSDIFNTNYGLDITAAFTEPNTIQVTKQIISLNLVRTLGTDPRVLDIRDVIFEDDPAYLARHPDVTPAVIFDDRHQRLWNVDVVIVTTDNQARTLAATVRA